MILFFSFVTAVRENQHACGNKEECFDKRQTEISLVRASKQRLFVMLVLIQGVACVKTAGKMRLGMLADTVGAALDCLFESFS